MSHAHCTVRFTTAATPLTGRSSQVLDVALQSLLLEALLQLGLNLLPPDLGQVQRGSHLVAHPNRGWEGRSLYQLVRQVERDSRVREVRPRSQFRLKRT